MHVGTCDVNTDFVQTLTVEVCVRAPGAACTAITLGAGSSECAGDLVFHVRLPLDVDRRHRRCWLNRTAEARHSGRCAPTAGQVVLWFCREVTCDVVSDCRHRSRAEGCVGFCASASD